MNLVTINQNNNTALKMNSQQIAELTNKTHSHVLRDIRRMVEELNDPYMDSEQYQVVMNDKGVIALTPTVEASILDTLR